LIGYSHLKFREVCKKLVHLSRALEGTQELNKPSSRNNLLKNLQPHHLQKVCKNFNGMLGVPFNTRDLGGGI